VLRRECNGLRLTFHLAGINNQNFLMRDEETGTYWQQISGQAVAGPLKGQHLEIISADELTFKLWRTEQPKGTVLDDEGKFSAHYAKKDWDVRMKKMPTVLSYAEAGRQPRDLMLGIQAFGASRAFPYETVLKEKLIQDRVGSEPILLVVGPDGQSVRSFRRRIPPALAVATARAQNDTPEFYRLEDDGTVMDSITGAKWNFQGCTPEGVCLERIDIIKDYWFDWRHYHPDTTVFKSPRP
jgi:hypothetical protein